MGRLRISRTGRLSGYGQRIRLIRKRIAQVRTADREADRASRQVKHIAAESEVFGQDDRFFNIVGRDENFVLHLPRILADAKWVEGGGRIGVEQAVAQRVVVYDAAGSSNSVASVIANAGFPFP